MAPKIMAAKAKVLVLAAGSWPGLQRPRCWVVSAAEAATTKVLAAAAKVMVVAVKVMTAGRVVAAAVVAAKVVVGRSRSRPRRPWLLLQRQRLLQEQEPRSTRGGDNSEGSTPSTMLVLYQLLGW